PESLASLIVACVAQAARDVDAGVPFASYPRSLIEENLWRALRYGLEGDMIDLERGVTYPASDAFERLLEWCAPARAELGIELAFPALNGTQRQRRMSESGLSRRDGYAATVGGSGGAD